MKRKTLLLFVLVPVLLFSRAARAQTYYVDISKTTNGTGTITSPFNSVLNAMFGTGQPTSSDLTIYFRKGTYRLSLDTPLFIGTNKSGLNGHYFILAAYPGEKVIFDGSEISSGGYMSSIAGAKNVRLQGFTFANLVNIAASCIILSDTANNVDIRDCTFTNMLWNSDQSEARFPISSDDSIFTIILNGNSFGGNNYPKNITIDTNRFVTIAPGTAKSLVTVKGVAGTVTQTADVDSNIIYGGPRNQFYVSPTGSNAFNVREGSKSVPWKTISAAVNAAGYTFYANGNPPTLLDSNITIYLRAGTYYMDDTSSAYIGSGRGKNGKTFTITNYPGEAPTVDGGNLKRKYSCMFIIDSASYVTINGLNIQNLTNDSTLTKDSLGVIYKDTRYGIIIEGPSTHISILNNDIYNMKWTRDTTKAKNPQPNDVLSAITVLGNTNTPISNLVIDSNTVHNIVPGYAEGVTINGNVDSFQVVSNEIYDVANIGIVAAGNYAWVRASYPSLLKANNQSRNGLIQDNTVYRCISPVATSAGIYLDGSLNVTVCGNESYNNGTGLSVGNEQDSSSSGGHTIISNNFWSNLGPAMYLGSNNPTSTCSNVVVKYNTDSIDFTINPTLYARANGKYGTLTTAGQYVEVVMNRIQHLTFDENEVYSSTDSVLAFAFSQSNLTFTYNDYFTKHNNPCAAYFFRDTVGNGFSTKRDSTFNQYGQETKLDTTSYLGGVAYNRHGCGTKPSAAISVPENGLAGTFNATTNTISVFPDPVVGKLAIYITQRVAGPASIELWDMSGKLLIKQQTQLSAGVNQLGWEDIKRAGVLPGVYILHIVSPGQNATRKLVVL
jgi:hypothetical protein